MRFPLLKSGGGRDDDDGHLARDPRLPRHLRQAGTHLRTKSCASELVKEHKKAVKVDEALWMGAMYCITYS